MTRNRREARRDRWESIPGNRKEPRGLSTPGFSRRALGGGGGIRTHETISAIAQLLSRQPHSTALAPRLWLKYAVLRRISRRSGGRMRMSERAAHTVLIRSRAGTGLAMRCRHRSSLPARSRAPHWRWRLPGCQARSRLPRLPGGAACGGRGSAGCLRSRNAGRIVARCCMGGGAVADPGRLPGRVVADARQRDLRAPARRRRR